MRLDCYAVGTAPAELRAARADRRWMDEFPDRHAYRCLPLSIANCSGWELRCPASLSIQWNGGPDAGDIQFDCGEESLEFDHFVMSNFTRGVVTFHTGYLFRTEPGWNLLATGPFNQPKDGISPLTGIVETSWLPYPFTMNWQLTRPGVVRFEKDEPFCLIVPVPAQTLETVRPKIYDLQSNVELAAQHAAWRAKRDKFMASFRAGDPATLKEAWQKFYFKGELPNQSQPVRDHVAKLRLAEPTDMRPPKPATAATPHRQEILVVENFLSREECRDLIAAFERCQTELMPAPGRDDGFFDHRFLWINSLPTESERDAKRLMQATRFRCIEQIERFYKQSPIYSDTIQLVKWSEGMSMPVHCDNSNGDDSPHPTPYRKFASVIYLNDDYDGGELVIPSLGVELKPRAGTLVAFRGDDRHAHGVKHVLRGTRYTMPGWYTDEVRYQDPYALEVY